MKARKIKKIFYISVFRPFSADEFERREPLQPPLQFGDQNQEFKVEYIIAHLQHEGKSQNSKKWKGYPDNENIWLHTKDLKNCQELF